MWEWLRDAVVNHSQNPLVQGLVAALGTYILEDPTTVTCGLLVAEGHMTFTTAMVGLSVGIASADFCLYLIGRLMGTRVTAWGLVTESQLEDTQRWFNRNLFAAVFVTRFIPGARLPTYLGAGVFRAHAGRFLMVAVCASLVWTYLLLVITKQFGEAVLPILGSMKWPVSIGAILVLLLLHSFYWRRMKKAKGGAASDVPYASRFEFWPPYVFYLPVAAHYAWLSLRHWGLMVPTAANPSIYSGGWIRESKSQILDLVPDHTKQWFARHVACTKHEDADSENLLTEAEQAMASAGLAYPVVAKPDEGYRGAGVQRITTAKDLATYLDSFPADNTYLLQSLVPYEHEAGILWYRVPGEEEGHIFSVTLKTFPHVEGDGIRTLRELIEADPRANAIRHIYFNRHTEHLDRVLEEGERFPLVFAGNHCQGAIFHDGAHIVTPALKERIHAIATSMPEFYFGRFDLRFRDLEALTRGEDLQIVEVNGASAEATHIWDARTRLRDAYFTLFAQFSILFSIGAANRKRGHPTMSLRQFVKDYMSYREMASKYPATH
jgi:membrane protein DedA with SNARE-associated domain